MSEFQPSGPSSVHHATQDVANQEKRWPKSRPWTESWFCREERKIPGFPVGAYSVFHSVMTLFCGHFDPGTLWAWHPLPYHSYHCSWLQMVSVFNQIDSIQMVQWSCQMSESLRGRIQMKVKLMLAYLARESGESANPPSRTEPFRSSFFAERQGRWCGTRARWLILLLISTVKTNGVRLVILPLVRTR